MASKRTSTNSSTDFIEYMASLAETNFDSSDSDDDDLEIVKEVTVTVENHRCDLCCKGDFLIDRLLRFGGVIDDKHKYVCDKCDKNFEHKSKMIKHHSNCEGPVWINGDISLAEKANQIQCLACFKTFKSRGGLTKHMNLRHSGLSHTCDICKEVFDSFLSFRKHCFEHEKRKMKYKCSFCRKSFHYAGSLKNHTCNYSENSNMVLNINKGK